MSKLTAWIPTWARNEITGEVMGIDHNFEAALGKALLAAGMMLPHKGKLLLSIADRDKGRRCR